jgi:hypothetical protein
MFFITRYNVAGEIQCMIANNFLSSLKIRMKYVVKLELVDASYILLLLLRFRFSFSFPTQFSNQLRRGSIGGGMLGCHILVAFVLFYLLA